jgi:hypothetical protein
MLFTVRPFSIDTLLRGADRGSVPALRRCRLIGISITNVVALPIQ